MLPPEITGFRFSSSFGAWSITVFIGGTCRLKRVVFMFLTCAIILSIFCCRTSSSTSLGLFHGVWLA